MNKMLKSLHPFLLFCCVFLSSCGGGVSPSEPKFEVNLALIYAKNNTYNELTLATELKNALQNQGITTTIQDDSAENPNQRY